MKKSGSMVLVLALAFGVFSSVTSAKVDDGLTEVEATVHKFYKSIKNYSDYDTYLAVSKDLRYSEEGRKQIAGSTFSNPKNANTLTDYNVEKLSKVSESEYRALVSQKFSSTGQVPAYEVPVIKENGKWYVIIEPIDFIKNDGLQSKNAPSANSSAKEIIAKDDFVTVVKHKGEVVKNSSNNSVISPMASGVLYYEAKPINGSGYKPGTTTFSVAYNSGTFVKGWQLSRDSSVKAWIGYYLKEYSPSGNTPVSNITIWNDYKQTADWYNVNFNNVPTSKPLVLDLENLTGYSTDLAGNVYN
ncbi:hypothetical protein PC41400_00275 [Paenibacillus chitinolyticus]|uniref:Uncharacterized protein n=1 Tax=Paenibacillus chitinolyticus TaxID=79263 RepID=A0A410WPC0_9BACL|nr:hypothetical protein [Paenibacillus chitinolyticus]MCY9590769.1 hypothetical protein [Paenibacillus chitinolyticus]MCY9598676.1 hypothetical protein [Paenibacillus chitinolyticus]QAV16215.1 hypothetical protein PC41400_00275 [Paenibacillus chitinolyticus]